MSRRADALVFISLVISLVSGLLGTTVAAEAQTIRVALFEAMPVVTVTASSSIIVSRQTGERLLAVDQSRLIIKHRGSKLLANGLPLSASAVKVTAADRLSINTMPVRGAAVIEWTPAGFLVVNEIDLEAYVRGVVPAEMPADWPAEALKAQAVLARTYALYQQRQRRHQPYDLVGSFLDQAYDGMKGEDGRATAAVDATIGEVLTFHGEPIHALYHANSLGATESHRDVWDEEVPYLQSVDCPSGATSPSADWQRMISVDQFERELRQAGYHVGTVATISTWQHSVTGRVKTVRLIHSEGELTLNGETVRRIMGYKFLPSTLFDLSWVGGMLRLIGHGAGHGVGLCQWGAKVQAEEGLPYRAILAHYYPGTEINTIP